MNSIAAFRRDRPRWLLAAQAMPIAWFVLIAITVVPASAMDDGRLHVESSANSDGASTIETNRRTHRQRSDGTRRNRRNNRSTSKRLGSRPESGDGKPIVLHFSGHFEIDLGDGNFLRGEGSTSAELDARTVQKWQTVIGRQLGQDSSTVHNLSRALLRLPETLETTNALMIRLADPDTQDQLRQIEQLFRLLPPATKSSPSK